MFTSVICEQIIWKILIKECILIIINIYLYIHVSSIKGNHAYTCYTALANLYQTYVYL